MSRNLDVGRMTIGLVPARDAASTIGEVVDLLRRSCDEVIVVDNSSTDSTEAAAKTAGAVVVSEPLFGKGHALRRGFRACLEDPRCAVVVTLDADGENDPSDVPCLLAPVLCQEVQVTFGVRTCTHSHLAFGRGTTGEVLEAVSGIRLRDPMCGVRAYSREALSLLLPVLSRDGFGIDLQIAVEIVRLGLRWSEILVCGDNVRSSGGWSQEHMTAAIENLAAYEECGMFPLGSVARVVFWSEGDRLLVLKTPKWEYRFRREGRLFVPER